jgi:cytochrome b561
MPTKKPTYDVGSMLLHWVVATLVFAVGLSSPFLDHKLRPGLSTFHNLGGTAALILAIGWLAWQSLRPRLQPLLEIDAAQRRYMAWTVLCLNILLVLGAVSGLMLVLTLGDVNGVGAAHQLFVDRLTALHHVLGALLVTLAGGHALHAVWHHVIRHNRLLARMLPWHER